MLNFGRVPFLDFFMAKLTNMIDGKEQSWDHYVFHGPITPWLYTVKSPCKVQRLCFDAHRIDQRYQTSGCHSGVSQTLGQNSPENSTNLPTRKFNETQRNSTKSTAMPPKRKTFGGFKLDDCAKFRCPSRASSCLLSIRC